MNKVEGIVLDWAGTVIDYGCFAPLKVFIEIFKKKGVEISAEEAREPMGLPKLDHVRAIAEMPRVKGKWLEVHGQAPTQRDINEMYENFEYMLFEVLPQYTTPIPGVLQTVEQLRELGYKIGSTTGYTKDMMNIVAPKAKEKGYEPDYLATPDDVKEGRPFPWMCYLNAMELGIFPMKRLVKVGDTVADMKEGLNAGMLTVGIILGSNELGLSQEEVEGMESSVLTEKMAAIRERFFQAGAHYVIDRFEELPSVLEEINNHLSINHS
ncbi:phosphonoacetaldehyde hydrolase [Metabacillus arenae]|uniref:Phosphonoacetaldehyde hydrolase n=1 Tax=Metabacillus arenae TaxID=2771434 RepID=A0A926NIV6_9BACI|nr:phosphonoacetaldehyde hydrolase [Metabacillus arenae]MBD1382166.1 phosphonoacetaldehyde hydrolase [Metabacillus arenae]